MRKQNCWEYNRCGREPGGENTPALGVCPAASAKHAHGTNSGKNGGRACWAIAGTFCRREVSGTFAAKLTECMECPFFRLVGEEEGREYMGAKSIFARIQMHTSTRQGRSTPRRKRSVQG